MKNNDKNKPEDSSRPGVVFGILAVAVIVFAGTWYFRPHSPKPVPPPGVQASSPGMPKTSIKSGDLAAMPLPPPVEQAPKPVPAPLPAMVPLRAQSSPIARALAANLLGLDVRRGSITPEQAQFWKQQYRDLISQGAQAVPAIQELLEMNTNINFTTLENGDQLGSPNLRQSLFDALKQIGGPEAIGALASVMQTSPNPADIALMADYLNTLAPGQYNDAATAAATAALDQATQSNVNTNMPQMSALFSVLQTYGGANAIPNLEQAAAKWNYYAPLALAGLPDGSGIPALADIAANQNGTYASSQNFALQMLAQLSSQYPAAAQALLAQIGNSGNLSQYTWTLVAQALGGRQTYYGQEPVPADGTDPQGVHLVNLNQNFASVNVAGTWTPQQIQNQIGFINQLMAANPNAAPMLRPTLNALTTRLGNPP